jgi:hypothetical protein
VRCILLSDLSVIPESIGVSENLSTCAVRISGGRMTQSGPAGVRPDTGRFSYGKLTEMPQSDTGLAPKCINLTWHNTSKSTLSTDVRISHRQAGEKKEKTRNAEVSVVAFSNSGYVRCICLVMPAQPHR